jgi:hypothetical protein
MVLVIYKDFAPTALAEREIFLTWKPPRDDSRPIHHSAVDFLCILAKGVARLRQVVSKISCVNCCS